MQKVNDFSKIFTFIDFFIENYIEEGDICVDATLGNGNDTLKLANKTGINGQVIGFDIQNIAIQNTKKLLVEHNLFNENILLVKDGHENLKKYVNYNIDFFIMNLGYLPSGDKNITTKWEDVILFLKDALKLLNTHKLGLIVFYPGHKNGLIEYNLVIDFLSKLNQRDFNIIKINHINQINNPPQLVIIERI